jgi:hypothetical protein
VNTHSSLLLAVLVISGLMAGNMAQAGGIDTDACRGGYSYLLVTEGECKAYLDQHSVFEQRKDIEALKNLEADYAIMLKERSESCPCMARTAQSPFIRRNLASLP